MPNFDYQLQGNILSLQFDGPISPTTVYEIYEKLGPLLASIDQRGQPWGTVLSIRKDASVFKEALDVFFAIKAAVKFKHQGCLALMAVEHVPRSLAMMNLIKSTYENKLTYCIEVFEDEKNARLWAQEVLAEISG